VDQARFELALKRIAKELDVNALASSCWTQLQKRYGISACSTFSRLNQQGLITACEVDLMGALTMYAMRYASLGQAIPDFIDWTDLHPTEPNTFLAWHCGNAAPSLCAEGCQATLTRNLRMIQWCENCHGALEFELKEVDGFEECFSKLGDSTVYELAKKYCKHAACPVPSAIVKGIEVACSLALPRDVEFHITKD
jgi:L-fucose isomerase-like protein